MNDGWRRIQEIRDMRERQRLNQEERARWERDSSSPVSKTLPEEEGGGKETNVIAHSPSSDGPQEKLHLYKPPGYFYGAIGKIFLGDKAYEEILEQSILTMQEEYFEKYSVGRTVYARWIEIRFSFYFLSILLMNFPLLKQLLDIKDKLI